MPGVSPMNAQQGQGWSDLLSGEVRVVNVGLEGFAEELRANGVEVVHVDWAPPAGGDAEMAALLAKLGL